MLLPKPLRGIVPPIVTPLLDRDTLDRPAIEALVDRLISAGVSGIFLLGTTGEASSLSYRLRREFVEHVTAYIADRVPVLVNITDTAMSESLLFADHAAKSGASGLVLSPPFYFSLTQCELLHYLERIAPDLPLPTYLYNFPAMTKNPYAPETVAAAASLPNLCGIKDSSGDMAYFAELIRVLAGHPDFAVFCGPEEILAKAIAMGAHGGIAGGANLWPELYVDLYRASVKGETGEVERLQALVMHMSARVFHRMSSSSPTRYLRGMKCGLSLIGACRNILAEPLESFGADDIEEIRRALVEVGRV